MLQRAQARLGKTIYSVIGSQKEIDDCAICLQRMGPGDTVATLACNTKNPHQYHVDCYANFIKEGDNYCPLCR